MKKIYLFIIIALAQFVCSENNLREIVSLLPDYSVPRYIINREGLTSKQYKKEIKKRKEYNANNMFTYKVEYIHLEELLGKYSPEAFNSNFYRIISDFEINGVQLENYLNETATYQFFKSDYGVPQNTYQKIYYNENVIGEQYLNYSRENYLYPSSLSYILVIVKDNYLLRIIYDFRDVEGDIPKRLTEMLEESNWGYVFKDKTFDFYTEFNTGSLSDINEYKTFKSDWRNIVEHVISYLYQE